MAEWFIMVMIAANITLVGPFGEGECQIVKRAMFGGTGAICIESGMIDGRRPV